MAFNTSGPQDFTDIDENLGEFLNMDMNFGLDEAQDANLASTAPYLAPDLATQQFFNVDANWNPLPELTYSNSQMFEDTQQPNMNWEKDATQGSGQVMDTAPNPVLAGMDSWFDAPNVDANLNQESGQNLNPLFPAHDMASNCIAPALLSVSAFPPAPATAQPVLPPQLAVLTPPSGMFTPPFELTPAALTPGSSGPDYVRVTAPAIKKRKNAKRSKERGLGKKTLEKLAMKELDEWVEAQKAKKVQEDQEKQAQADQKKREEEGLKTKSAENFIKELAARGLY